MYKSVPEIVRLHTYYHNNQYRYFPTLSELRCLFDVIETEVLNNGLPLPNYLRIIPCYVNVSIKDRKMCQGTQEEYLFFMECSQNVTNDRIIAFRNDCYLKNDSFGILNKQVQDSLFFLVDKNDSHQFVLALNNYFDMLVSYLIPQMYKCIKITNDAAEEEMCLGEFLFEIHCN